MGMIDRVVNKARRRMLMQLLLDQLCSVLLIVSLLGVVLVCMKYLLRYDVPNWSYAALGGFGVVVGVLMSWLRRPSKAEVAAELDTRLGLKDTISTSLYIQRGAGGEFANKIESDAASIAEGLKWRRAFRLHLHRQWVWVPVAYAMVVGLGVYLAYADFDLIGKEAEQQTVAAAETNKQNVQESIKQIRNMLHDDKTPQQLNTTNIDQLLKEMSDLRAQDIASQSVRDKALMKMSQVNQDLEQTIAQQKEQLDWAKRAFSRLDTKEKGPADDFAKAMRRGDFDKAKKALDKLMNDVANGNMSAEDKQALTRQLQSMSSQLSDMAKQQEQLQKQVEKQIDDQLKAAGLNQQQRQQLKQGGYNQSQVQQALQKSGQTQQQAQQMAKQIQKQQQQRKQSSQNCSSCNGLSQSLSQMASSMSQKQGGANSQQQQQSAQSAQQQLSQMQQMQQQMQQMQMAQSQMQQAMQNMSQQTCSSCSGKGCSACNGTGKKPGGSGQKPGNGPNSGGRQAGKGTASPWGPSQMPVGVKSHASKDIQYREGRVIADWQEDAEHYAGEMQVEVESEVKQAVEYAERAVTDDQVSRRHQATIKEYFRQLPDTARKETPAAPE